MSVTWSEVCGVELNMDPGQCDFEDIVLIQGMTFPYVDMILVLMLIADTLINCGDLSSICV